MSEIIPSLWFDQIRVSHCETGLGSVFQVTLDPPVIRFSVGCAFEHSSICVRLVEIFECKLSSANLCQRRGDIVNVVKVQANDSLRQNDPHHRVAPSDANKLENQRVRLRCMRLLRSRPMKCEAGTTLPTIVQSTPHAPSHSSQSYEMLSRSAIIFHDFSFPFRS